MKEFFNKVLVELKTIKFPYIDSRKLALEQLFGNKYYKIEDNLYCDYYDYNDYIVLTEKEINQSLLKQLEEYIFRIEPFFLQKHISVELSQHYIHHLLRPNMSSKYNNDKIKLILHLIKDIDFFIKDLIEHYGRAFLFCEEEPYIEFSTCVNGTEYFIYKQYGE